jgi:hypothetical protein
MEKDDLKASDILLAEFCYGQETAAQAMEDRHKMVNYYLIIVGVLLNAVATLMKGEVASDIFSGDEIKYAISALLFTLFIIGVLYILKLVRLREAWGGSAKMMNGIKKYYDENLEDHELIPRVLTWNHKSYEKHIKLNGCKTLFFYSAFLIMLIDSLALGGGVFFITFNLYYTAPFFVLSMVIQFFLYRSMLKDKK